MIVMKSLISINRKFMDITPRELVDHILHSKYIKGFEIFLNAESGFELEYLYNLLYEVKKNNLILQVHSDINVDYETQLDFLKQLEQCSTYLGEQLVVVFHSIYDEDITESLRKTSEYLGNLVNNIDNSKLVLCLENLNSTKDKIRLGKNEIRELLLNNENLYFSYDIGHAIVSYESLIDFDNYMFKEVRNVHIHTCDRAGDDHKPIYKDDLHWNDIIKGLTYLIYNNYQYNVVYEYDLYSCRGSTLEEKLEDYIESADMVSERYN